MTREEIMNLGIEELEQRSVAIAEETREADATVIEQLNEELDAIEERKKAIFAENEKRNASAQAVIEGAGSTIEQAKEDRNMPTNKEIRNSQEYVEAFAKYIKTGKDAECRALLTENVTNGVVPVPEFIESRVRTAWESDDIWNRISKTYVAGNLKVGFELSATDAVIHTEGSAAPAEETLTLGIVTMVPANIKKWITVSDEVLALGAESFLSYIYDELTYKIIKKASAEVINAIVNAPDASTSTKVGIESVSAAAGVGTVIAAEAGLSSEASNIVAVMNRSTYAAIRTAALSGNYAVDPFDGATVLFTDALNSYEDADADATYMIVGDLSGVQANMPEGDSVTFKFDDLSLAEKDMVKIVARLYAAIAVVGPKFLVKVTKPGE